MTYIPQINQDEVLFHKGYEIGRQETIRNAEVMSRLLEHSAMPWRLQIAAMILVSDIINISATSALTGADALIAEHERGKP